MPVTMIYQDNKSTILLSENCRESSSKHTKHLDVRHFFVTENMLADFFTKPLQGAVFQHMYKNILNLPFTDSAQECVGQGEKMTGPKIKGKKN